MGRQQLEAPQVETQQPIPTEESVDLNDLIRLSEAPSRYPHLLAKTTLHWALRTGYKTGLRDCIVRFGKRDFLIRSRFERWLARRAGL